MIRYPWGVEEESEQAPEERRFMTVCVSAFAARSRAIVSISDKAVTYGTTIPIQSDTGIKKMIPVGECGWYALIAGNPSFATAVVEKTKELMLSEEYAACHESDVSMMGCMRVAYQECRKSLTEDAVLRPYLLTTTLWAERSRTLLPLGEDLHDTIQGRLEKFSAKTSLLVFGFSSESPPKPHLFSLSDPGISQNHDVQGFYAVGIGHATAIGRMMFLEVDRNEPLDRTLYEVFDAKVNAELVQGVGYNWDGWIMLAGKSPIKVRKNIREMMDKVIDYEAASPFERPRFTKREKPPDDWRVKLKSYTDGILKSKTANA